MSGQDGGMVDNGAMCGVVDDIHGNELSAKWHHIQFCTKGLVLVKDLNENGGKGLK